MTRIRGELDESRRIAWPLGPAALPARDHVGNDVAVARATREVHELRLRVARLVRVGRDPARVDAQKAGDPFAVREEPGLDLPDCPPGNT